MNKLKIAFLILLSIISFSACEKDDICIEEGTPLLIIRFYDFENQTEFKTVPSLRIIGVGLTDSVNTISDRTSSLDSISIPLKINDITTGFTFITNSEDNANGDETGISDIVNFNYLVTEKYISRACGFVANFDDLNTDFTADSSNWIKNIKIEKNLVTNETITTTHVKIFH